MAIIKKKDIDELVDTSGSVIDGDRNATNDSEIETGPVNKPFNDDSEYEKGVSTMTDRAAMYHQNIPWFAVYSYSPNSGRGQAIAEVKNKFKKSDIEKKIEEDLVKKSKDKEVLDKATKNDFDKAVDAIEDIFDVDFSKEQLKKIKDKILNKLKNA